MENFWLFVEYSLATPGTNIEIQKIFYIAYMLWMDKKIAFLFLQSKQL